MKALHIFLYLLIIVGCAGKPVPNDESISVTQVENEIDLKPNFEAGKVHEKLPCSMDAQLHFACYAPQNFNANQKFPVLVLFDPHGDPLVPIEKYKSLADYFGYILVSSYDSKNGNGKEQTAHIIQVMAQTIYEQLPVDSNRIYAGGFSGGGRIASLMAFSKVGIQGLVTCGAGFPRQNWTNYPPNVICAIALDGDMNLPEISSMQLNNESLEGRYFPVRYKGIHEWPSAAIFKEAFLAFDAVAMRDKYMEQSISIAQRLNIDYIKIERENKYRENLIWMVSYLERRMKAMQPFENIDTLKMTYAQILNSPTYQQQIQQEQQLIKDEEGIKKDFYVAMGKQDTVWWKLQMDQLHNSISVAKSPLKKAQLQRINAALSLACYMNLDKTLKANVRESYVYLSALYRMIDPDNSEAWFLATIVACKEQNKGKALEYLQIAIANGFNDRDRIASTTEFNSLLAEPLFNEILNKIHN
jgi:hypothetical protein